MPTARAEAPLVAPTKRHLKWHTFDNLERGLMGACGLLLLLFTLTELADVGFRLAGRPWLTAGEFAGGFFVWGVFVGWGLAVRRDSHFRLTAFASAMHGFRRTVVEVFLHLVMLAVSLAMVYFGYLNFLTGFGSYLQPSGTPIAVLYAAIVVGGALSSLFVFEQLFNGLKKGFEPPSDAIAASDEKSRLSELEAG